MTDRASLFPSHLLIWLPGLVDMKAKITVKVLAKIQATDTEKMTPKTICLKRQVIFPGHPMKRKEQRKQRSREERRAQVIPQLLALTMGVWW